MLALVHHNLCHSLKIESEQSVTITSHMMILGSFIFVFISLIL